MRYHLIAIGQVKRGPLADACAFYEARLARYAKLDITELKEAKGDPKDVQQQESDALLKHSSGFVIALDEKGKTRTSMQLAAHITALETRSISQVSLLIGGAEGHSNALKQRVDESWRLSTFTMPHELARVVLLEQLYRIETIRAGHPYHRE